MGPQPQYTTNPPQPQYTTNPPQYTTNPLYTTQPQFTTSPLYTTQPQHTSLSQDTPSLSYLKPQLPKPHPLKKPDLHPLKNPLPQLLLSKKPLPQPPLHQQQKKPDITSKPLNLLFR